MNRYTLRTGILEAGIILLALIWAIPIVVAVNMALRPTSDSTSALIPSDQLTFDNFVQAWQVGQFGGAAVNSGLITILSVVGIVVVSAFAAYPLARSTRLWSSAAFYTFMVGLLLPFQLANIPLYITMRDLDLLGTIHGLVIFYIGLQMPFSIFLYTQFLRALAPEYEEAARIDGAGSWGTFVLVVFPLLRPVTGTVVILNVIFVWNDFFTPLLYLSGTSSVTLPVAIYAFTGQYAQQWNLLFAGIIIAVIPILVAYFLMQRSIIKGFAGGLKG